MANDTTAVPAELQVDTGTIGSEINPPPVVSETQTAAMALTDDVGFGRQKIRALDQDYGGLHQRTLYIEWRTRTADVGRTSAVELISNLADLGFAWRDIARLVGVSVPALQKWRRGEGVSGESRLKVASLVAACALISERYEVREIASWFEMPLVAEAPVTPMDLYAKDRADLVFEHANGHTDPEQILSLFDPDWRERYRSDFEVFRAQDGQLSIRPKV